MKSNGLHSHRGLRYGVAPAQRATQAVSQIAEKTVLEHTLDAFERHARIGEVVIVGLDESVLHIEELANHGGYHKVTRIVAGGATRQQSSAAGVGVVNNDQHKVLVHDAARPLIDRDTIDRCIDALDDYDAVDTAIGASDTVIRVDDDSAIDDIPDRSRLRLGQTPQAFRAGLLRQAHAKADEDPELKVTDDCGLVLRYGLGTVKVVEGDTGNIKITYPSDIYLADRLFQLRSRRVEGNALNEATLAGKNIVLFGASRGIGQSIQHIAEQAGGNVVAVSRADGVDVADEQSVRATLKQARQEHGPVDAVILTAGILRTGLLAGQDYDTIDEQLTTNLRGCITVAREAFEAMNEHGGSIALFTSSSYTRGRARSSVYSATKAAVVNLMQALSEEFRPFRVRINAVNPERTATPMRTENFGEEPSEKLLDADSVARATLAGCFSDATGEVIDVRR